MKSKRLGSKRGFTLVEIIVVIAIIGVLAMILVPTMMNYVTSSSVTSANSTAASIKNSIDLFLTSADTAGYGMRPSSGNMDILNITVTGGTWTVTANGTGVYDTSAGFTWSSGSGASHDPKVGVTDACGLLAINLATSLPEVSTASIMVSMRSGKCLAVAFSDELSSGLTAGTHYPATVLGEFPPTFIWNSATAGVAADGNIVGTAPVVALA